MSFSSANKHNHLPSTSGDYDATTERRRGQQAALQLLGGIYQIDGVRSPKNPDGTISATDQLLAIATQAEQKGKVMDASLLRVAGLAPEYGATQEELNNVRATARDEDRRFGRARPDTRNRISTLRDTIFNFNGGMKEYLDLNSSLSLDFVASLTTTTYRSLTESDGGKVRQPQEVFSEMYNTARGMRGELVAEQILGKFEDVDIQYRLTDDEKVRRELDRSGKDYMISVTLLDHTFDLGVDIKASESATVDKDGYTIPGKLWSQCTDSDFIGNTSRVDSRTIGHKILPMQDALIEQITLQHPGQLERLCQAQGLSLDDLDIN